MQIARQEQRGRHALTVAIIVAIFVAAAWSTVQLAALSSSPYPWRNDASPTTHNVSIITGDAGADVSAEPLARRPRTVALVFYGRARFVEILDCYLRRNLKIHGGVLDEVQFLANTWFQPDLDWLDGLITQVEQYRRIDTGTNFASMWEHASEPDTVYVKLDDDIVWMDDDALPRLVDRLHAHPEALAVGANIVNSPLAAWFHVRVGAIRPFVPESSTTQEDALAAAQAKEDWRTSGLPRFPDAPASPYNLNSTPAFDGSRMLLLPDEAASLKFTPMHDTEYDAYSRSWSNWAAAAQQHYSLLWNLEHNALSRYRFGSAEDGTVDLRFAHYSINALAIWGRDVDVGAMNATKHDDEMALTMDLPRQADRPFLLDSHALVAHYSFSPQQHALPLTDVLARYRALANEKACGQQLKGAIFSYESAS